MTDEAPAATFSFSRLSTAVNYLLVAIITAAMMAGPITILFLLFASPFAVLMIPVCFLVAIEGILTTHWLNDATRRQMNRYVYRLAEWVFILVALRLFTWAVAGSLPPLSAWREYLISPLKFFDIRFVGLAIISFFAWERSLTLSGLISRIPLNDAEEYYYSLPAHQRSSLSSDRPVDPNRRKQFNSVVSNWIAGGVVLVVCAALSTVRLPATVFEEAVNVRSITRLGLEPGIMLSIIIYFVCGLWLIGRLRLSALRTRWIVADITVQAGLQRVWYRSSLLLILAIALAAAFLPIGSTLGISRIIAAVSGIVLLAVTLIIALISGVLYLLLSLLQPVGEATATVAPTPPPTATPPPPPPEMSEATAIVLGSTFWVIVIVVVIIALVFFLRGRGLTFEASSMRTWWQRAVTWLRNLWRGATGRMAAVRSAIQARRPKDEGDAVQRPWRFIRLGALSAREQIRYFYLSTVRRAGERGVQRPESATPQEYADELKESWPEAEEEIGELTEAFLRARYSADPIDQDEALPVKDTWKRVRSSIRSRKK